MPSVSVILPTYNRSRFLPDAFASIQQQTLQDWELIIIDDGSADDTAAVVDEWRGCVIQPMKFIRQQNHGAYGARNTGLDHAEGEFVAFFDSDDVWLPQHLDDCVRALRAIKHGHRIGYLDNRWRLQDGSGSILAEHRLILSGERRHRAANVEISGAFACPQARLLQGDPVACERADCLCHGANIAVWSQCTSVAEHIGDRPAGYATTGQPHAIDSSTVIPNVS